MKNKTWIIFFFLIVFLLYVGRQGIVNYGLQYTFESSPIYDRGKWVQDNHLHPEVVFLGSSMTKYSIIPNIIMKNSKLTKGSVVNLGSDAATPYEMYVTFIKNKKSFRKTKVFFYSIEPWIFSIKYYQYKIYEKVLWSKEEWRYYMPHWDYYFSYKTSLYELALSYKDKMPIVSNYGYFPKFYSKNIFKLSTEKEVKTFFEDKLHDNMAISHFQLKYLKKLKDEIEKNNAKFIILYIPNHISYTNNIFQHNKLYNSKFEDLLNKYLGETKQYGAYCPINFNLVKEDYFDKFHLSDKGAKKYSRYLGNVLQLSKVLKERKLSIDYHCEN